MGIHAGWNFTQSGIFGVATSGVESNGYLMGSLRGNTLLSGGSFGAEGSVVAVVVCLAMGVALLTIARRKDRFLAPSWRRSRSDKP